MVDWTPFYNFRQVASAQSVVLFNRESDDRRPLVQDLPIQIQELPRLLDFVLKHKRENPGAVVEDFVNPEGIYYRSLQDEIEKCNRAGYSRIDGDGNEPDIQQGYIVLSVFRGFSKPKKEIDAILDKQKRDREEAERAREEGAAAAGPRAPANIPGVTRTAVQGKFAIRKRTPPQRTVMPQLRLNAPPLRVRSKTASSKASRSRSGSRRSFDDDEPPFPPPFGGGSDGCSTLSVGQESSLTRLLNRIGTYESMSELWTVDTNNLRSLFPDALRMREPQVVVAEMEFSSAGVEPDVLVEDK